MVSEPGGTGKMPAMVGAGQFRIIQPAFHAKPVSTSKATKMSDAKPKVSAKYNSESDAGDMSHYNPNLR